MDEPPPIAPDYSVEQGQEIGRIDYLLDELGKFRDRGVLAPEAFEALAAEKAARRSEIERLGLAGFVLDVVFQVGRIGIEHALARRAIMLALGIALGLFVALNQKRPLRATIR